MSTLDARQTRLSADDRYELASRAQNQQRLNAPKHLIVFVVRRWLELARKVPPAPFRTWRCDDSIRTPTRSFYIL